MEKEVVDLVQQLRDELIEAYKDKGLEASGNYGRETKVIDEGTTVKIVAPHYVYQMVSGRRAGTAPPVMPEPPPRGMRANCISLARCTTAASAKMVMI